MFVYELLIMFVYEVLIHLLHVGRMGYLPAHGGNDNSRNVSCSKPIQHYHKRLWEGALYKWLTKSASDAVHTALYK